MISWVMDWVKVGCTEKKTHDVLHLGVCGNSRGPAVCCVHESSIKWSVKTQCTMGGHFTSLPGLSVAGWNSQQLQTLSVVTQHRENLVFIIVHFLDFYKTLINLIFPPKKCPLTLPHKSVPRRGGESPAHNCSSQTA